MGNRPPHGHRVTGVPRILDLPLLILPLVCGAAWGQSGYRLEEAQRQMVADAEQHWDSWDIPVGTMTRSVDGLRPRRWNLNANAVRDIVDFLREDPPSYLSDRPPAEIVLLDAVAAGSNRLDVLNVLDGDPTTYWEPDPLPEGADLQTQWWFSVDLGRVVVADRIVLKFVDEELGDPFYVFEVLTSDGMMPVSAIAGQSLDFRSVLKNAEPNTSRRHFEVDFSEFPGHSREMVTRFIKVIIHGSRFDRGVEVEADEYERLRQESPDEVGAVEFIKILKRDSRELPVSRAHYEQLPEEKQGPVRYYRRERPRLADIEVWVAGEDLANKIVDRGGSVSTLPAHDNRAARMFDGNVGTFMMALYAFPDEDVREPKLQVDMGSFFWVRGVRFILRIFGSTNNFSMDDYRIDFSDGSLQADGSVSWVTHTEVENVPKFRTQLINYPDTPVHPTRVESYRHSYDTPIEARFMRIVYQQAVGAFAIDLSGSTHPFAELRIFSEGFQPRVTIESPLMDPRGTRNLTSIEWDATTPPGTSLYLQTRTSKTRTEVTRYFNRLGEEVDSTFYAKNLHEWKEDTAIPDGNLKGDITTEVLVGGDASPWSEPYFVSGDRITSPSPRSFVQVRATLVSDSPDTAATLHAIRLNYTEPLADGFLGELSPTRVETLAVERPFSIYVRPEFGPANPGLDGLLLAAPDGMRLHSFAGLYAGSEADLLHGTDLERFKVEAQDETTDDDSLLVTFPVIGPEAEVELLRLDFSGELFSVGGKIRTFALLDENSGDDIVWQEVDEGDASSAVDHNSLVVVGLQSDRELFTSFDLPAAFSPNGDGVNDLAALRFSVVLVGRSRAVSVQIHDLSGRLVRRLDEQRPFSAGAYRIEWNGNDDSGRLVPPGIYALRFHIDADTGGADLDRQDTIRSIAVVY